MRLDILAVQEAVDEVRNKPDCVLEKIEKAKTLFPIILPTGSLTINNILAVGRISGIVLVDLLLT